MFSPCQSASSTDSVDLRTRLSLGKRERLAPCSGCACVYGCAGGRLDKVYPCAYKTCLFPKAETLGAAFRSWRRWFGWVQALICKPLVRVLLFGRRLAYLRRPVCECDRQGVWLGSRFVNAGLEPCGKREGAPLPPAGLQQGVKGRRALFGLARSLSWVGWRSAGLLHSRALQEK